MVQLSRILSIAVLVVHLMVGCCARDAHGCESKYTCSAVQCDATPEGQCAKCRCDCSHHGPQECQGRKCSLTSPRRQVSGVFNSPLPTPFASLSTAHSSRRASSLCQLSRAMGRHLLAVRLHLANLVLLI